MTKIIVASVFFLISIGTFIVSVRSFQEKGFLFNNAYLYASKQEREKMDKKPHYRQSAIAFLLIGVLLLLFGINVLLSRKWLFYVAILIAVVTVVYAVASSVAIEKRMK